MLKEGMLIIRHASEEAQEMEASAKATYLADEFRQASSATPT